MSRVSKISGFGFESPTFEFPFYLLPALGAHSIFVGPGTYVYNFIQKKREALFKIENTKLGTMSWKEPMQIRTSEA